MKRLIRRFALGTLIVYSFSFTAIQAHPRLPKPEVKAQVSVKDRSKETRRDRRRREDP